MKAKKITITYIFGDGRSEHILSEENFAKKDFFYGYFDFKEEFENINFIEFSSKIRKGFLNSLLYIFSKVMRKITKLSFFFENICTFKNLTVLSKKSNYIILTNDRIGMSTLPLLLILKIYKKKSIFCNCYGFTCKRYSKYFLPYNSKIAFDSHV